MACFFFGLIAPNGVSYAPDALLKTFNFQNEEGEHTTEILAQRFSFPFYLVRIHNRFRV